METGVVLAIFLGLLNSFSPLFIRKQGNKFEERLNFYLSFQFYSALFITILLFFFHPSFGSPEFILLGILSGVGRVFNSYGAFQAIYYGSISLVWTLGWLSAPTAAFLYLLYPGESFTIFRGISLVFSFLSLFLLRMSVKESGESMKYPLICFLGGILVSYTAKLAYSPIVISGDFPSLPFISVV
ncbi:hypothetical protein DRN93_04580, partial [archaeon]